MNFKSLIIGIVFFLFAYIFTFFQANGQFMWEWFRKNEWAVALMGIPLSFLYIYGTKYTVEGFGGLLWPTKFIAFGVGTLIYTIFVGYFFGESMNLKTIVSLSLAVVIICIQVLWK